MMNNGTHFIIEQQRQKYARDLQAWAYRIRATRSARDALTLAKHPPSQGPFLRGLGGMSGSDRSAAYRQADAALKAALDALTVDQIASILPYARGMPDFPSVTRWVIEQDRLNRTR